MNESDLTRLGHMRDAAREALSFLSGRTRADLDTNRMLLLAVCKEIEIIGEAANQIGPAARAELPDAPWLDAIRMRNRLIHGYSDLDPDVIWRTTQEDLPPLLEVLDRYLAG